MKKIITIIMLTTSLNINATEIKQVKSNVSATIVYNCANPDEKSKKYCPKKDNILINDKKEGK